MEDFLANVCTVEWNERQDAGRTFAEARRRAAAAARRQGGSHRGVRPPVRRDDPRRHRRHRRHPRGPEERRACRATRSPTGRPRRFRPQRQRFAFLSWFDGIVVSGEEGVIKPDPRIFRILLERYRDRAGRGRVHRRQSRECRRRRRARHPRHPFPVARAASPRARGARPSLRTRWPSRSASTPSRGRTTTCPSWAATSRSRPASRKRASPAMPASSSAASFRARPRCCGRSSRGIISTSCRAGTARNSAGDPSPTRSRRWPITSTCSPRWVATSWCSPRATAAPTAIRRRRFRAAPCSPTPHWPAFCAKLNEVARHLRARGVRLAFHHHMGTVVQTEAEIDRLMANTERRRRACCSTRGTWSFAGGDPVAVARRHGARIVHVHCKDVRAAILADVLRDDRSFLRAVLDGVFTVPGDGSIDFAAVLRELRQRRLCGLARRRGRAGSGEGASAHLCAPGLSAI